MDGDGLCCDVISTTMLNYNCPLIFVSCWMLSILWICPLAAYDPLLKSQQNGNADKWKRVRWLSKVLIGNTFKNMFRLCLCHVDILSSPAPKIFRIGQRTGCLGSLDLNSACNLIESVLVINELMRMIPVMLCLAKNVLFKVIYVYYITSGARHLLTLHAIACSSRLSNFALCFCYNEKQPGPTLH